MTWRERLQQERGRLRNFVEDKRFERVIIAVILVNAITLGLEASHPALAESVWLQRLDLLTLGIFVVELAMRLTAHGRHFFRDPWSVFDLFIVGISLLALLAVAGQYSVLRTLRILRVLRLASVVPRLQEVVLALLSSIPGMAAIGMLLALLIYVAAVMATQLFGAIQPAHFGNLATSLFSLFQIMTTEGWPEIAKSVMEKQPLAWIFFVIYLLVSTFTVLNLFVAVVVRAIERTEQDVAKTDVAETDVTETRRDDITNLLKEVRALREEIAELRRRP